MEDLRPLMFSVAYGMLGSVTEAEDITQEALLRMHRTAATIEAPSAYAVTVTTRLAIDQLRSARARREVYVGAWLPEPLVVADPETGPAEQVEAGERLSLAFLVLLERLSPVERAVLLLREVFDYDYERIAVIVGRSPANCRQILVRAKAHVHDRARFQPTPGQRDALTARFFAACTTGDLAALEQLLAADITLTGDGGGKVPALASPAVGRRRVARFILGLFRQAESLRLEIQPVLVNGGPGARAVDPDGAIIAVVGLEVVDGVIVAVHNILNPDKLRHLGRQATAGRA